MTMMTEDRTSRLEGADSGKFNEPRDARREESQDRVGIALRELRQTIRNCMFLNVALWAVTMTLIIVTLVAVLTK